MTFISILGFMILLGAIGLYFIFPRYQKEDAKPIRDAFTLKKFSLVTSLSVLMMMTNSLFFYAEPGMSYLVQYPWGTQKAALNPGFQLRFFGNLIPFKKVLTVKFADEQNSNESIFSALEEPIQIRFNDAVSASVEVASRFRLPRDEDNFLKVAVDFRSMDNLINSALIPLVRESVRNSGRMISAQEFIVGKGGEFEIAVLDQLENGIYRLETSAIRPFDKEKIKQDERSIDRKETIKYEVSILKDEKGIAIRKKHALLTYGISISQATIENVDPEFKFKEMLSQQRDAAAQANVEREKAKKAGIRKATNHCRR